MANTSANQFYVVEKEINGTLYKAQFSGLSCALNITDNCYIKGSENRSSLKMSNDILEKIIVEPSGLTVDSFDTIDELNDVIEFGRDVMQGKFRKETDKGRTKKASE